MFKFYLIFLCGCLVGAGASYLFNLAFRHWRTRREARLYKLAHERGMLSSVSTLPSSKLLEELSRRDTNDFLDELNSRNSSTRERD